MNQPESSLEKARGAAKWFHEKVPIAAFPSYRTDYVIALLTAYAASAVALEREDCARRLSRIVRSGQDVLEKLIQLQLELSAPSGERKAGEKWLNW